MSVESAEHDLEARKIEQQIDGLRSELDGLVGELDRRRHAATDVRLQVRKHPRAVALIGALAVLTVVGRLTVLRRRRAETIRERAVNLARALAVLSREDPARVKRALEGKRSPPAVAALAKAGVAVVQSHLVPGLRVR